MVIQKININLLISCNSFKVCKLISTFLITRPNFVSKEMKNEFAKRLAWNLIACNREITFPIYFNIGFIELFLPERVW